MVGRFANRIAFLGLIAATTFASPDASAQGYPFSQRGIVASAFCMLSKLRLTPVNSAMRSTTDTFDCSRAPG